MKREALARLEVIADTYLSVNTPVQLRCEVFETAARIPEQVISRARNLAELDHQLARRKSAAAFKPKVAGA